MEMSKYFDQKVNQQQLDSYKVNVKTEATKWKNSMIQNEWCIFSSLHWTILALFCVLFIQWSMLGRIKKEMYLCAKRASKVIVMPKEM